LFKGSIGRTDFPDGDQDLLVKNIKEKLFNLPDDTIVFPGHGPATTIGEEKRHNPFLREQE
jgi:glyoxylase-like metal-dependent hydrolase (beta-lactamase superfamily II)